MNKLSIKIIGTLIVVIFFFVLILNIMPSNSNSNNNLSTNSVISNDISTSTNINTNETNGAKIISLSMENDKLKIVLDDGVNEYCIKTTKTKPSVNSICFKRVDTNIVYASIYKYKKYYIWTKDYNGNISNYISVDSRNIGK